MSKEAYESGAVRGSRKGKGRFDLIPPEAMHRIAERFEEGAEKYPDRNWEKGIPISRHMDSAFRHMYQYMAGHVDEDHLAAAATNIMMAMTTEDRAGYEMDESVLDLPWQQ